MTEQQPDPMATASLYLALFEAAPDAMIVADHRGRVVLANPQAERLFGYAPHELDGLAVEQLLPPDVRAAHQAHRTHYMANPHPRPMGAGYELAGVRKDGQPFPAEISLSPVGGADQPLYAASIRDISETRRARQALVRARYDTFIAQIGRLMLEAGNHELALDGVPALLAAALEIDTVAIVLRDSLGLDPHVRAATGFPQPVREELEQALARDGTIEALGVLHSDVVVSAEARAGGLAALQTILPGMEFKDATVAPLFDRHKRLGMLLALASEPDSFDHDKLHFLQTAANMLAAAVQRSRSEEQLAHVQRLDALGQLTGGIAHDFNNLLTVISGNLQLMEIELGGQTDLLGLLHRASHATTHCTALTRKLLGFARRRTLSPRALRPGQVLSDLAQMLGGTLGGLVLTMDCPDDIPCLYADPGELEAALVNLAINARDAMPKGGRLGFSVSQENIDATESLSALRPGTYVAFEVTDTGTGMSADVLARAQEPFFTTKSGDKGSGLGLSMVYGFATQSGGDLGIDSQPGQGTRVRLRLPAASAWGQTIASDSHPARPGHETVLVVEDEPEIRRVAVAFLQPLGYTTLEAADGDTALELLAQHPQIGAVFCDVVLGGRMDGFQLARSVRRLYPHLPMLLTSGYEHASAGMDGAASEAFHLLHKPYRREELTVALREALDRDPPAEAEALRHPLESAR
jgi:PAS domain S-box-containing protein